MYTKAGNRKPGKFESCESQLVGKILHGILPYPTAGSVQNASGCFGVIKGRRRTWIVHEDHFGFYNYRTFNNHKAAMEEFEEILDNIAT